MLPPLVAEKSASKRVKNIKSQKLKFGMVGGGVGSFIGPVHRIAAEMDGLASLVCGAFSSNPQRSKVSAQSLYRLPQDRAYASYEEMLVAERELPRSQRMDFVVIATPNHMHYPVAMAALDAGFHVVCDKPVAFDIDQAFDDFAAGELDAETNRTILGIET